MNFVLGAGKRLTVDDLVLASRCRPNQITVDDSAITKANDTCKTLNNDAKGSALFVPSESLVAPDTMTFDVRVVRAALIYRLSALLNLRTPVKGSTIKVLADLINYEITPYLSSVEKAGEELLLFLSGKGFASNGEGQKVPASEALSLIGSAEYHVSIFESRAFINHPFLAVGMACVSASGATNLLKVVDAISALSCEAAGAKVDAFDPVLFETYRQHRGQMLSATNLKLLLEGSKRVNSVKDLNATFDIFHSVPQTTGPCQETIAVASKALDIELNSCESSPLDPSTGFVHDFSQVHVNMANLNTAISQLANTSLARANFFNAPSSEVIADAKNVYESLLRLTSSLATELSSALKALRSIETEEANKKNAKAAQSEDRAAAAAAAKGKPQNDDSNLTPEQLAKVMAKRKEKEEKAAAKAAAKEQRKGGLVLGAGSTQLRALVAQLLGETDEATTSQALLALLNPFDLDEKGFVSSIAKIVEQLNVGGKRKPKIAKGARDFTPEQMRIREQAFNAIRKVFKRHGGVEIDTPVFELKEVLTGKYGEDSKLIYDLADQGGELLSLRYDLTVPFARFLAMNSVGNIKRYHIAKVYRRDNPQLARGRYREFYQCDFDIAGTYSPMVPDAEVITVATEILSDLPVGNFLVKLNHRKILDAIFEICGVPAEKFRPICSAVDKLDKMSWEDVKAEMVNEKGLDPASADKIGTFVLNSGKPFELWEKLMSEGKFGDHAGALDAMKDLKILFGYLEAMGSLPYVSFDLSLARGLDYYTGVIYEVVLTDGTSQVGSIAAGGRYDNLVGMFSTAGVQTPCVGVSIGIERVFTIMEKKAQQLNLLQQSHIQVYIASIGADMMHERMKIAQLLWNANISAEYSHLDNPKFKRQLDESLERGIPFMVVFGSDEIKNGVVKVKDMRNHTEVEVPRTELINTLLIQGCSSVNTGSDQSFIAAMKNSDVKVTSDV